MTTANKITVFRILVVPFFIVQMIYYTTTGDEWHRLAALLCFGIAALTDGLDGYIARKYNQRSELGTILDPLADKILLVSGIILLSLDNRPHFERLPLWLTGIILGRDVILVIGLLVIHYTFGKIRVRPRVSGKVATVLQMATVLWILLHWDKDFLPWLTVFTGGFTALSGVLYLFDGMRQLGSSPASAAAREP